MYANRMKPRVLGIGGSLRKGSHTLLALEITLHGAAQAGAETELLDLKELSLPFYDDREDADAYPESVSTLLKKVREAKGLILASPVYHGAPYTNE